MGITYNSGAVNAVTFNSNALQRVTYNGNEVWGNAPSYPPYLIFSSPSAFTLEQLLGTVAWDGTLEYSTDKSTWATWDGTSISAAASNGTYYLYMRGTGNTVISSAADSGWYLDGSDVSCDGDIRMLLDYADPENATAGTKCFFNLFNSNDALIKAPDIMLTQLSNNACYSMFMECGNLVTPGKLAATNIGTNGCAQMFMNCFALSALPEIKATSVGVQGMQRMFNGCSLIKLSATQTGEYQTPYRIPSEGTGSFSSYAASNMFINTGGTFVGTPTVNTTYYTSNTVVS